MGEGLYVCENCGRLGPMADFQEDCRPGWTHGRLWTVDPEKCSERVAAAVRELLSDTTNREES
jgi:hypothetical protein